MNQAFERLEQGNDQAIKDYYGVVSGSLNGMIEMVLGQLTSELRTKIKTLITIEVHSRDVVQRFIDSKVENATDFAWQSQLRYRWDDEQRDCASATPSPW